MSNLLIGIKRYYILVLLSILCVFVAMTYFSRTSYRSEQKELLVEKKRELRKIRNNKAQAVGLAEEVELLKSLGKSFDERLISRAEKGRNLDYFYKLEADVGLTLQVDQSDQTDISGETAGYPKLDLYDSIGFRVQLNGTTKQIVQFLNQLRVKDRFCRLTSFYATAGDTEGLIGSTMNFELLGVKPKEKAKK